MLFSMVLPFTITTLFTHVPSLSEAYIHLVYLPAVYFMYMLDVVNLPKTLTANI